MCRWLAYLGSPVTLDTLLYRPEEPFVEQSRHAQRSIHAVNGDGCGIGWYGSKREPAVFRSVQPAWNNANLFNLSQQIESRQFLTHVRASSGTAIQESNCHPFQYGSFLFQHNGFIREYSRLKQRYDQRVAPELYSLMQGSTDTERLFFLALTFGLERDPPEALARMAGFVEAVADEEGVLNPLLMTVAVSNGSEIFAVRYSSGGESPSLYHSRNLHALREVGGDTEQLDDQSRIILSEPLDEVSEHWEEVPEGTLLIATPSGIESRDFAPAN